MPFIVAIGVFALVFFAVWLVGRAAGTAGGRDALIARGVSARGLILKASQWSTESAQGLQRFEVRKLLLDVEIPGEAPYEVSVSPLIPRICEACPGAALDLRIDPKNRQNVAIVGPLGTSGWIGAAPWLSSPGLLSAGTSRTIRAVALATLLSAIAFVFALANAPHTPERRTTQRWGATMTCDSAARCCKVISNADCGKFTGMPEATCARLLQDERKAASKVGKRCP